jgi:HEAT repeat protein
LALLPRLTDVVFDDVWILWSELDDGLLAKLFAALKDKDKDVCVQAAHALGRIRDPRAIKPLIAALKEEDYSLALSAAQALSWIGEPADHALTAAVSDIRSPPLRRAIEACMTVGDHTAY